MVIWLIGISASGKTTLGREIVRLWRATAPNTVLVDGDDVRDLFRTIGAPVGHSLADRRRNSERIIALCDWLDRQGINVVCCILSLFHDMQRQNRGRFSQYLEVFVDTPLDVARSRDTKGVYTAAATGHRPNIVGIDIPFQPPPLADLRIDNAIDSPDMDMKARQVLALAGVDIGT
jgi:adenylylsulfate kinase-like enzyme